MENEFKQFLHTKRGLLALLLGFKNQDIALVDAIEKAPSLAMWTGGRKITLGDDPGAYDTLMDYAYPDGPLAALYDL